MSKQVGDQMASLSEVLVMTNPHQQWTVAKRPTIQCLGPTHLFIL